jgi:predicted alpha/beta superfamily hydrolase
MKSYQEYKFNYKGFNYEKIVRVFHYADDLTENVPVIYMHDGENLFFEQDSPYAYSWNLIKRIEEAKIPCIIVGIDSRPIFMDRLDEMCPFTNHQLMHLEPSITRPVGGNGDVYLQFIIEELKPFIDSHYPTLPDRDHTLMMGSSMGGFASCYAALKRPDLFRQVACLSSTFWFAEQELLDLINEFPKSDLKIYLDYGTEEHESKEFSQLYKTSALAVNEALKSKADVRLEEITGGTHTMDAWGDRIVPIIEFLLKNKEN